MKKCAVGYIRVSTARQAHEGVSLDAQRELIQGWSKANGYELLDVFVDTLTATNAKRPHLHEAMDLACQRGAALVVFSLSRFARSTLDAIELSNKLKACGAELALMDLNIDTTTPYGNAFFQIMAALAELESSIKGERVKMANAYRVARGRKIGGLAPLGFKKGDGGMLVKSKLYPAKERARALRDRGLSLRGIALKLHEEGYVSTTGKMLSPSSVRRLMDVGPEIGPTGPTCQAC